MRIIKCKTCGGNMNHKNIKDIEIDECSKCHDVWFDAGEMESYLSKTNRDVKLVQKIKDKLSKNKELEVCSVCQGINFCNIDLNKPGLGYCKSCDGFYLNHKIIEEYEKVRHSNKDFFGEILAELVLGTFIDILSP